MKNWKGGFSRKTRNKKGWVEIRFKIQSNGDIIEANVTHQSGIAEFDGAALRAIHLSSPLPPLPSEMTCTPVNATYRFYYNIPENQ
jgi:TonB family protein